MQQRDGNVAGRKTYFDTMPQRAVQIEGERKTHAIMNALPDSTRTLPPSASLSLQLRGSRCALPNYIPFVTRMFL